jgi:hypothetical protein
VASVKSRDRWDRLCACAKGSRGAHAPGGGGAWELLG